MARKTDEAWNRLHDAVVRVEKAQDKGDVAKRNAQRAFLAALRGLREAVLCEMPAPRKKRRVLTLKQRKSALRRRGYVPAMVGGAVWSYAKRIGVKAPFVGQYWLPRWVVVAQNHGVPVAEARKMRKSPRAREALLALAALRTLGGGRDGD